MDCLLDQLNNTKTLLKLSDFWNKIWGNKSSYIVSGYLTGATSLSEIKVENVADKLKMYSALFNEKAMEEFS